jgi:hypothetical protein
LPLEKLGLEDEFVFKLGSFFNRIEMMKEFVGGLKQMTLFDIGVGGEGAETSTGKDHIAGLHIVSGVAQFMKVK